MEILLVRLNWFGDVLLTLPVIDAFCQEGREVSLLTSCRYATLLVNDGRLSSVLTIEDLRVDPRRKFETVIDLHSTRIGDKEAALISQIYADTRVGFAHCPRPDLTSAVEPRRLGEHAVDCYLRVARLISPAIVAGPGAITVPDQGLAKAVETVGNVDVSIVPGSRDAWRRWSPRKFAALATALSDDGFSVCITGHAYDEGVVREVRSGAPAARGLVTDDEWLLAASLFSSRVVVANNSALAHLAALTRGPRVVCIESHLPEAMWTPWGDGHTVIRSNSRDGCSCDVPEHSDPFCAEAIALDEVLAHVRSATNDRFQRAIPG